MGSVGVFSYVELYMTAFGWMMYGAMWNILVLSGIAWWPFVYALYIHTRKPMESQESKSAAGVSLRRVQWELLTMLFVVAFGVTPFVELDVDKLAYRCAETPATLGETCATPGGAVFGATGTTYDLYNTGVTINARVPVLWALAMSLSGGVNQAAIFSIPRVAELRTLQNMIAASRISDAQLAGEMKRFMSECYMPAANKLNRILAGEEHYADEAFVRELRESLADGGVDLWPGSPVFWKPGLYMACFDTDQCGSTPRASRPVNGWPYDPNRDTEDAYGVSDGFQSSRPGTPYCIEWWAGTAGVPGLRHKLANEGARNIEKGPQNYLLVPGYTSDALRAINRGAEIIGDYTDRLSNWSVSPSDRQDYVAERLAYQAFRSIDTPALVDRDAAYLRTGGGFEGSIKYGTRNIFASTGSYWESFKMGAKMPIFMQGAPMVQSILILALLATLPALMVFGRYSIEILLTCLIAYITIRFWTVLWAIANWADQTMLAISAAASASPTTGAPNEVLVNLTTSAIDGSSITASLISLVTMAFYVGFPIVFSIFMGWVGYTGLSGLAAAQASINRSSVEPAADRSGAMQNTVTQVGMSAAGGAVGGAAGSLGARLGGPGGR